MEPKTPLDSPSLQEERYHAEDTCAGDTDFLYISRTAETYNRIDSLCIEPTYTDHIRSVETDSVGGCVAEYCGFATSFKGYPVEGGILKAIASYARMVEVKKDFTHSNFAENTDAVTVDLSTSKAVTRFQLNSNTHCSSMLESASVNVHDMSILRQYDSKEYADHRSISTMYIEHKKMQKNMRYLRFLIAHFPNCLAPQISPKWCVVLPLSPYPFMIRVCILYKFTMKPHICGVCMPFVSQIHPNYLDGP